MDDSTETIVDLLRPHISLHNLFLIETDIMIPVKGDVPSQLILMGMCVSLKKSGKKWYITFIGNGFTLSAIQQEAIVLPLNKGNEKDSGEFLPEATEHTSNFYQAFTTGMEGLEYDVSAFKKIHIQEGRYLTCIYER